MLRQKEGWIDTADSVTEPTEYVKLDQKFA